MHEEEIKAAMYGRIGSNRMMLGLGCIPDKVRGDMERVIELQEDIIDLNELLVETVVRLKHSTCPHATTAAMWIEKELKGE